MEVVINFLKENAEWMFGGGGIAAILLALPKIIGGKKDPQAGITISGGHVGNDVTGRDSITNIDKRNGVSGRDIALILAVVVALVGVILLLLPAGTNVTASNCSAAVSGSGNTTNVVGGCD